jgi:hypothetical protein
MPPDAWTSLHNSPVSQTAPRLILRPIRNVLRLTIQEDVVTILAFKDVHHGVSRAIDFSLKGAAGVANFDHVEGKDFMCGHSRFPFVHRLHSSY